VALPLAISSAILSPQRGNQLERVLCMALFTWALWMPQTLPDNSAVRWSSQMINLLQNQFNRFIHHQTDH
jgi:inner membrane protein